MKNLLLCVLLCSFQTFGGAWTQDQYSGETIQTFRHHANDGVKLLEWNPYAEWGLTDSFTLGANLGISRLESGGASETLLAYSELTVRYKVLDGQFGVLSVQPMLGSTKQNLESGRTGTTADGEMRVLWGISTPEPFLYLNLETAYRSFFGEIGAEWRADLSVGWKFLPSWILLAQYFAVINLEDSLSGQEYTYHQAQGSVIFPIIASFKGQLGISKNFIAENIDYKPTYLFALWYEWKN